MITVCAKGRKNILSLWVCACFCWHCAGGYSSGVRLTCITAVPLHQKNDWKNTLPLRSIGCTLLTTLGFLMYHIRGKTGGKPQVLLPHVALNQRVPEGFIAYVHLSSCLSPGSGVSVPIISKFLLFHKYFLIQPPVPSGLCFSFLLLITST